MTSIRNIIIAAGLFVSLNLHAQTAMVGSFNRIGTPIQTAPPDSIVAVTAESQGLSLVAPEDLPFGGTFWEVTPGGLMAPLPCPPIDQTLPIYAITDTAFLVDATGGQVTVNTRQLKTMSLTQAATSDAVASALDTQATAIVNLINQVQTASANQQMRTMAMAMGVPTPGGDGGTNSYTPNGASFTIPDYGTNLWIAQWNLASGSVTGIASNTLADVSYDLVTNVDLTTTNWGSTGLFIVGSETTNWTPLPLMAVSLTNNCFFRLRSWASSDGSGLPDWWQEQYFGVSSGVDPYGNPAGDGYSNLQKFQNGMNPNQFYTPAAPQLAVSYDVFSSLATVSWTPKLTPATSYTVKRFEDYYMFVRSNVFNLSGSVNSLQDNLPNANSYVDVWGQGLAPTIGAYYQIQAHYTVGDSAWSAPVYVQPNAPASITLVPGPQGSAYLAVASLPAGTTSLRVIRIDTVAEDWNDYSFNATNDIPVSASTNGLYLLPAAIVANPLDAYGYANYWWNVEPLNEAGASMGYPIWIGGFGNMVGNWIVPPYFDGRAQLKQNLIFKLRGALADAPFQFSDFKTGLGYQPYFANQSNYVSASFFQEPIYYLNVGNVTFDAFWPFLENTLFQNFVFSLPNVTPTNWSPYALGHLQTGVHGSYDDYYTTTWYPTPLILTEPAAYQFTLNTTNGGTIPALLNTNSTRWLGSYPMDSVNYEGSYDGSGHFTVITPYLGKIGITASIDTSWDLIYTMAGNARNYWGLPFLSATIAYANTANTATETTLLNAGQQEENIDGYFYPETAQPQFQTVEYDFWNRSPLPESTNFSTANPSDLLMVPVGSAIGVNGYAKLAVQNGYSGVYAYLGQYFDKAYKMTNGTATTNTTGVLSPYGNFFATEPGPAALVTMPDVDTGERGTCIVHSVSLVLDKNHDLKIDGSFNGPDATSQASPMVWWINDDYDYSGASWDLGQDVQAGWYYNDGYQRKIDSQRDLEDYARLWICGMPALTNGNYQVTLSWANVSSGSPTINLFDTVETNGGIGYLTNLDTATAEAYNYGIWGECRRAIATISPGQPFTIPASYFTNAGDKHFLFDGAITNGAGELMLTIADGNGNTIAQTGAWLDMHDVKDFYERAVITNNISSSSISNWTSGIEVVQQATASALGDDTNLIVLVHGINVGDWDWQAQSDTVFKRLYWAGYRGKIMTVKWPCNFFDWSLLSTRTSVFNQSEVKAYKAGAALKTYIDQLHARFPGCRLNLLVHSQGNAIVGEAIKQGASFNTYILTQGAMPDSSYDANAPTDSTLTTAESVYGTPQWQPMGYHGIYTNFIGRIVNFYNTNDPVLACWEADQAAGKPNGYAEHLLSSLVSYYSYDGANGWNNGIFFGLFSSTLVTDPQESRAMISRSLTLSIGQSPPESGHGVIQSGIDLKARFGFNNAFPADHSAQWTWPIQTSLPYYLQILDSINP